MPTSLGVRPDAGEARPRTSAKVRRWYLLACILPFALSLLLPYLVWRSLPSQASSSESSAWVGALFLAGWVPYLVGVAGKSVLGGVGGEAGADEQRSGDEGSEAQVGGQGRWSVRDLPGAEDWRMGTTGLAWILGLWGVLASFGLFMMMAAGSVIRDGL